MLLKTGENDYRDEKVLLEKSLCPPHAFEKGGAKTAEYYFRQQLITNTEEVALAKIKAAVQQYEELLKDSSFGDLASFHLELARQLYYSTDYCPPPEAFYQHLQDNLNEFFQDSSHV